MTQRSFEHWMLDIQSRTEAALANYLPSAHIAPTRLHEAMRYAVLGGGKRVRPLLTFAAGELCNAKADQLDAAACAVEFIHAYSLVHDDMPCMDDDVLRRGKPTVHIEYDEATALLVGDSLQTLAFQVLADHAGTQQLAQKISMLSQLAHASGSRGMAGGQAIDLASVGLPLTREELEFMHIHKTGALIRCAVLLGAYSSDTPLDAASLERLDHFAKVIGLLFQVVDDVLDCEADTATLGKTAGKDAANNKPTYVSLLGLRDARQLANDLQQQALTTLQTFGDRAERLQQLTRYIVTRSF